MRLSAVIGANYGDEGKGHTVDYLSDQRTLVARFNGGSQAGHTVTTPDGRRHVFHHFGAGTFQGATTFLTEFFLVNPILYVQEHRELATKGVRPKAIIDPNCRVTTPWDMMLNQAAEAKRGPERHGSCGVGINETVTRGLNAEYRVLVRDLVDHSWNLKDKLRRIQGEWVPRRATELGVDLRDIPWVSDNRITDRFLADWGWMLRESTQDRWDCSSVSARQWDRVVFEGAQGLRLDEFGKDFPHVTRSRTGLTNVLKLMDIAGMGSAYPLDVYYVTRPYLTRHGAGPLKYDLIAPPYSTVRDATNVPNQHQGFLRYAWLDTSDLTDSILEDLVRADGWNVKPHLSVTCLDQVPKEFIIMARAEPLGITVNANELYEIMDGALDLKGRLFFYGETRDHLSQKAA